jgi:hypothetical protein
MCLSSWGVTNRHVIAGNELEGISLAHLQVGKNHLVPEFSALNNPSAMENRK